MKPVHVLVSPLDWGLGHASRCIPLIKHLIDNGFSVMVAGSGRSLAMLRQEFPSLDWFVLPGFSPSYPRKGNMVLKMLLLAPAFLISILKEHFRLKKIIRQQDIDIVISDNRYGLWSKKVISVLITHQVMIKTPGWLTFAEPLLYRISGFLISRFDACWIPDRMEVPGLSGDLSHKFALPGNACFIGTLSRLSGKQQVLRKEGILAVLSGPEPQRSLLEEILVRQLSETNLKVIIVCGKPEFSDIRTTGNITLIPHLQADELERLICNAELIICRSGYSSIMDLEATNSKALLIPTPGQTEQLYLARIHQQAGHALFRNQHELKLPEDIKIALTYKGFKGRPDAELLVAAIQNLKYKKS